MNRTGLLFILVLVSVFISCGSSEIGSAKDVNPETIYFDYRISGEEGNDNATVMLQYRFSGENGTTLTIDKPGKVQVDGETLDSDSTKITGAYYELQKPAGAFAGKHTIQFTNLNGKRYDEEFSFQPFTLIGGLPDTLTADSAILEFAGLKNGDILNILMTDTVFGSDGVERRARVKDGKIFIDAEDLENLAGGPIHLELELEKENILLEFRFLKAQVNPHFLFNTLNNIYALARKKSDDTADVVMKLSKLLRFMLYESQKESITIIEEIQVLDDLIELEKIKYSSGFTLKFQKF